MNISSRPKYSSLLLMRSPLISALTWFPWCHVLVSELIGFPLQFLCLRPRDCWINTILYHCFLEYLGISINVFGGRHGHQFVVIMESGLPLHIADRLMDPGSRVRGDGDSWILFAYSTRATRADPIRLEPRVLQQFMSVETVAGVH